MFFPLGRMLCGGGTGNQQRSGVPRSDPICAGSCKGIGKESMDLNFSLF